jgi:hypothetical protein
VKAESCHVQLRIDSGDADENDGLFEEIESNRAAIEERFGESLMWNMSENHRGVSFGTTLRAARAGRHQEKSEGLGWTVSSTP